MYRKRLGFHLVFSNNPPAADVVRKDYLISVNEETKECHFRCDMGKDEFVNIEGKILDSGFKKDLIILSVNRNGVIGTSDPKVGTRRQEVERERLAQKNALALHQQEGAEMLLNEGPDAATRTLQPVIRSKQPSLPKKRHEEYLSALRAKVNELPCFHNGSDKYELWRGKGVYCDLGKLGIAKTKYWNRPKDLFQAILRAILPRRILTLDGISVTGKRYCVPIPARVLESVLLFVTAYYQKMGGDVDEIKFNPQEILKTRIGNLRKKFGTNKLATSTSSASTSTSSTSSASTSTSSTSSTSSASTSTSSTSSASTLSTSTSPTSSVSTLSTSASSASTLSTFTSSTSSVSTLSTSACSVFNLSTSTSSISSASTPSISSASSSSDSTIHIPTSLPSVIVKKIGQNSLISPEREHSYFDLSYCRVNETQQEIDIPMELW